MNPSNAPLASSLAQPTSPDPDAVEFLGLNLDAFRELVAFAEAAEGFTLAIAEVNYEGDGDLLVQALQRHPLAQTVQFIELNFGDQPSFSLLGAIKTAIDPVTLDPHRPPVLLVRGLATAIGVKGHYPKFLRDLNYSRDQFARQVPYPMVLVLPDYAINRLAQYGKDLWNWKSGLFRFRTGRQTVNTAQTQLAQPSPQPRDTRPAKQDRIEQLERLLSEQINHEPINAQPGTPDTPTPHPRSSCIPLALELGDAYMSLSDFEQARRYYHKALDWAEAEEEQKQIADALYGLGEVHRLKDDSTVKALARYQQAMALYRDTGDRLGEANVLQEQGKMQVEPQKSLRLLNQAQAIFEEIEDGYSQCRNLVSFLADAQLKAGQREAAIKSLHRAADMAANTEFAFFRDRALRRLHEL
ncbi:MAG: tetratricopeptide repeat protein [Nodosilinea sp.]